MPTYSQEIPNWRCQPSQNVANIYGVVRVDNLQYENSFIGSNTYGIYDCLVDCVMYKYLQIYAKVCKDYNAVGINIPNNTYQCCRYGSTATGCQVSCFETLSGIPTSPNTCGTCSGVKKILNVDVNGNPTSWTCIASGYTCRLAHMMLDQTNPLVNPPIERYCYDCPSDDMLPVIVPGSPFGFQCKFCSRKHYYVDPVIPVQPIPTENLIYDSILATCPNICNIFPKFNYNSLLYECQQCVSPNNLYDSDPAFPGCKSTCPPTGAQTGRGFNADIKYCGRCYDQLVTNTDDCKLFCVKPKYQLILSETI
jgi:hypothetical protein